MADEVDIWARAFVSRLLQSGKLELVSDISREGVIEHVAVILGEGEPDVSELADRIVDLAGVAELSADDDALSAALKATHPAAGAGDGDDDDDDDDEAFEPDLERYDEAAKALLTKAQKAARGEVTVSHLLLALLADPQLLQLAQKRGGDPSAARAAAETRVGSAGGKRGTLEADLERLLMRAEDDAPNLVRPDELVLAGLGLGLKPFREAFAPKEIPAPPKAAAKKAAPPAEPTAPAAKNRRGSGPLALSAAFKKAFALAVTIERERDTMPKEIGNWLPAALVVAAEEELETALPDDFWAMLATGLPLFYELGLTGQTEDHEPLPPREICEWVLATSQGAAAEIEDDLVVIADLSETGDDRFIAVKKGVKWADRNDQLAFTLESKLGSEREKHRSFGDFLHALLKDVYPDIEVDAGTKPPAFAPKLV